MTSTKIFIRYLILIWAAKRLWNYCIEAGCVCVCVCVHMSYLSLYDKLCCQDSLLDIMSHVWLRYTSTSWCIFDVITKMLTWWCIFDIMMYFLMSWHIFDMMTNFLTSWHIFWRHVKLLNFMTHFWLYDKLFDIMTNFLTSWRTFWRHDVIFMSQQIF